MNDVNEILAHDAQYTVEQKRAKMAEPYREFIREYTTVEDFYNRIIDNIVTHVKERLNVEGEYIFWNSKADFLFRKHYSGGRPDEANGLRFGDGVTPDGLTFRSNGRTRLAPCFSDH